MDLVVCVPRSGPTVGSGQVRGERHETIVPTIGGADNDVYFTREQFAARFCFPIPSLVKQFLHFTRAPPTLIHPNVFRILIGCRCAKLSLPAGYFVGRDLFYLHFEAWD